MGGASKKERENVRSAGQRSTTMLSFAFVSGSIFSLVRVLLAVATCVCVERFLRHLAIP